MYILCIEPTEANLHAEPHHNINYVLQDKYAFLQALLSRKGHSH
jgi:hypothetical protein